MGMCPLSITQIEDCTSCCWKEMLCQLATTYRYPNTPGIYTEEQIEAWKPVTKSVREAGGIFFCQLWHCGRSSHPGAFPSCLEQLAKEHADFSLAYWLCSLGLHAR
jgi:2,4-dienoyl-CoA reductase-like NADH-dependent reductase (Old Yellow Enzyme family)